MIVKIQILEGMAANMKKIIKNEFDEPIECHFHSEGCTHDATDYYQNWGDTSRIVPKSYPACSSCLGKREKDQKRINERYLDIKPFTGQNAYGEYYDEDSY